jgi:phosphoenolpyruvate carboxykinase (GTP)
VLEWIIDRAFGEADAVESPIGYLPKPEDINLDGLDVSLETLRGLLSVDKELWREEAKGIHEFYAKFGDKLPPKLKEELANLEKNLA